MTDEQALAPTPELAAHHDMAPPEMTRDRNQPAWSIRTRVAALHERGVIDEADMNACKRFRDDWELGVEGARDGTRKGPGDPNTGLCYLDHQVAALGRLRAAEERLGDEIVGMLRGIIVLDLSWPRMAVAIGVAHEDTAKARGVGAIKALTLFWTAFDGRKSQAS